MMVMVVMVGIKNGCEKDEIVLTVTVWLPEPCGPLCGPIDMSDSDEPGVSVGVVH